MRENRIRRPTRPWTTAAGIAASQSKPSAAAHRGPQRGYPVCRLRASVAQRHGAPMYFDEFKHQLPDIDEAETQEWLDSLDQVVDQEGENRARFLMFKLLKRARQRHVGLPSLTSTRYINTISPEQEPHLPGRRGARAAHPAPDPLERGDDGAAGEQPVRGTRRPPRHVRLGGQPVRGRVQPLLQGQGRSRRRRPGVLPGPRGARASTPARSSRAACPRTSSTTSGARSRARA